LLITLLDAIQSHLGTRTSALQELINVPEKTLERHIKILRDAGLIEYKGSKKQVDIILCMIGMLATRE
jgi:DNA-binding IclR family transcriptional regulator